jgi:RNA recognition motif-containing protein
MANPVHVTKEESVGREITPSNILFADNLPQDCNEMMLACLFRSYAGYKEVRIPRPGLAFIEFDEEPHATVALKALNGFKLSADDTLNLKYGKS